MKKPLWTAEEICCATHSSLCSKEPFEATGVAIDSRDVQKGDLFVALKGEKVNGHDFLEEAFQKGAVAALVEHVPSVDYPHIVVRNTVEALCNLGRAARNRLNGRIVGITGSAGKTSTKDMVAMVLSAFGKTYATRRSFNSTVTVPLSLACADVELNYGVFEMGMNHAGEIEMLTKMVRPHIAVVTNVAPAHLQHFESVEAIAQEKAAIFLGLPSDGFALIPGDNPQRSILESVARVKGIKNIYSFGQSLDCQAQVIKSYGREGRFYHDVLIFGKPYTFSFEMPGIHWAYNGLVSLLVAHILGLDLQKVCTLLETYKPTERRGVPTLLRNDILLVDESYNANPLSMKMALESFGERSVGGRKIVILGDMRELGARSEALHKELKESIIKSGASVVLTCGEMMKALHHTLEETIEAYHFDSVDTLIEKLLNFPKAHDAVMVKASLSMGFIKIIETLKKQLGEK